MISGAGSLVAADPGGLCDQWHNGRADSPAWSPLATGVGTAGVSFGGSGRVLRATPRNNAGTLYGFVVDATSGNMTQVPGAPFGGVCYRVAADASGKYLYAIS